MAPASGKTSSASKSTSSTSKKIAAAGKAASKKATKKAPAKKATAKKAAVKKATAKQETEKKTSKKAAKKAPAKKATAKKAATKKAATKKAPGKTAGSESSDEKKSQKTKLPSYLTDKSWLKSQRALLVEERRKYTHSAASLAAEAQALMADREPGDVQFDEESGEGDTLAVERDRDLALSGKALENVAEIDAALDRLDNGSYGICVTSGEVIPRERLEAIPWASKTVAAQTAIF